MSLGILVSYVEDTNREQQLVDALIEQGSPVVWDSGAFSVFTGKATITPEDHTRWVLDQPVRPNLRFVGLDVVGDSVATLENYRTQRAMGAVVEPTIHYGDPVEQVRLLLDVADTDWLNIGGLVPHLRGSRNLRHVAAFIAAVRRSCPPEVRIHALGCTTPTVLRTVQVDAVDSSAWLAGQRYRQLSLFDSVRGRWLQFDLGSSSTARRLEAWAGAHQRAAWLRSEYGVSPTELIERAGDRHFVLSLAIEATGHLAEWVSRLHGKDLTVYLAGSDHSTARHDSLLRHLRATTTTPLEGP